MPELPEVETTRRGLEPHVAHRRIREIVVREPRLRWPVPADLGNALRGHAFERIDRRGKYLLLRTGDGPTLMIHLGMSGHMRVVPPGTPARPHDHVDIMLEGGPTLRYNDPRRFGSLHVLPPGDPVHPLLARLGPEPLSEALTGHYLHRRSRGRRAPVKTFLMDAAVVVGVGNIYASEALFRAGIRPTRPAGRIAEARYERLADTVKAVLAEAIEAGGTTLRDFAATDGQPGYFSQRLDVYGRAGAACVRCATPLLNRRIGQRATVFCPTCQR